MITRRTFLYKSAKALIALPFLLACGCQTGAKATERVDCSELYQGTMKADYLFLLLIDRTGSFWDGQNRAATIRNEAAVLARQLPPSSVVMGRFICDNSYSDAEIFLRDAVPQPPPMINCEGGEIFNEKCQKEKRRRQALEGCVEAARQRIAVGLLHLNPPRAGMTDLWGAMAAISEILDVHRTARRAIFLWSDLGDNVGSRLPAEPLPGFEGASMIVMTAGTASPEEMARRREAFARRLSDWRPTVSFRPLGALAGVGELLDRRVEGP